MRAKMRSFACSIVKPDKEISPTYSTLIDPSRDNFAFISVSFNPLKVIFNSSPGPKI